MSKCICLRVFTRTVQKTGFDVYGGWYDRTLVVPRSFPLLQGSHHFIVDFPRQYVPDLLVYVVRVV